MLRRLLKSKLPLKPMTLEEQLERMQQDWDRRARENARHFVNNSRTDWTDQDFFASGEQAIAEQILTDTINIYQGKDPAAMRVLEIGCGAGRLTRALSNHFGEVHAVDVSGEMVARARAALHDRPNVTFYKNNGCDLAVVPPLVFDFAYSSHVFQHIPSREVIESYVREVHRLLRPGGLFKFQVQGHPSESSPDDTWHGVSFTAEQAAAMAQRCGFENRYSSGEGQQYFTLWFFKPKSLTLAEQLELMQQDWDQRARENARHFVNNSRTDWTDQDFFASGEQAIAEEILTDTINIYQGKDPAAMRVLEIGCGAGRLTRALSNLFGEVHAVDVSGEMVARARAALRDRPNVTLYQNNGCDLAVVPPLDFDFAYSSHVFQHIPSREVIDTYVREVHRLLRPGALFKFQVQGCPSKSSPDDTWHGVFFTEEQAAAMAQRCGFENRYSSGEGQQYFTLWFFKPPV